MKGYTDVFDDDLSNLGHQKWLLAYSSSLMRSVRQTLRLFSNRQWTEYYTAWSVSAASFTSTKHEHHLKIPLKKFYSPIIILAYPQTDKPYKLYSHAWDYAVGGILVQVEEDYVEREIQYVFHQLDPTQKR